jgi:hypothetical protein
LEGLWQLSSSRHENIIGGAYDALVVQATLSSTGKVYYESVVADTKEQFRDYAKKFNELSRRGGARTVLFMQWQFNEAGAMPIENIECIHRRISEELEVEVAPVGLAWRRAQEEQPDLKLLLDPVHANVEGSYLAACVLYSTIYKQSPVGLFYLPEDSPSLWPGMSAERAAFLQRIAWQAVQEYEQTNTAE